MDSGSEPPGRQAPPASAAAAPPGGKGGEKGGQGQGEEDADELSEIEYDRDLLEEIGKALMARANGMDEETEMRFDDLRSEDAEKTGEDIFHAQEEKIVDARLKEGAKSKSSAGSEASPAAADGDVVDGNAEILSDRREELLTEAAFGDTPAEWRLRPSPAVEVAMEPEWHFPFPMPENYWEEYGPPHIYTHAIQPVKDCLEIWTGAFTRAASALQDLG